VEQAVQVISSRVLSLGVEGPIVQRHGSKQIVVQIPGVDDPERVKNLITRRAHLEFKIIKEQKYEAWDQKLSKDGKYTVYSNSVPSGGSAIFVRSIETDEVTQITKPLPIGTGRYSKDSNPDWFQG